MRQEIDRLREYYDRTDTADLLEGATPEEPEPQAEPMVTYALRLPQPVLEKLRAAASQQGVRVSALMREWLEERLGRESTGRQEVIAVDDLLALVAKRAQTQPQPKRSAPGTGGKAAA